MTDIGDMVRLGNYSGAAGADAFRDIEGDPADPADVRLIVSKPSGPALVYTWPDPGASGTLVREAVGQFYADVEIDQSGTWRYRLEGTGAVVAAAEGSLRVQRRRVEEP